MSKYKEFNEDLQRLLLKYDIEAFMVFAQMDDKLVTRSALSVDFYSAAMEAYKTLSVRFFDTIDNEAINKECPSKYYN